MNELIMPHNVGVKNALESMKEVLALYKKVIGNYRPLLDGERYLTDKEVSEILKVSRRTLQEYRNNGILPYIPLGGKILYRESDLQELLEKCYHPAYRLPDD
ncbi:MAG: helix-turn-helix domain-containing protein [Prevotella sp.]|nr:helix-turn-helix domain-containing protein [Prevotella sp.]